MPVAGRYPAIWWLAGLTLLRPQGRIKGELYGSVPLAGPVAPRAAPAGDRLTGRQVHRAGPSPAGFGRGPEQPCPHDLLASTTAGVVRSAASRYMFIQG